MIVDRGHDFPSSIQQKLDSFGGDMWLFRDDNQRATTRALNSYKGENRGFEYLTPRIRLTPRDLTSTKLERPRMLHFICSPSRALNIVSEIEGWSPTTIYEPIPYSCVPDKLPVLLKVLPSISILRSAYLSHIHMIACLTTCMDGNAARMQKRPSRYSPYLCLQRDRK